MCTLRVRFSQSSERRGVFNYALKVEVSRAIGIPSKIFVYHQSPAGLDGNTFAEFDHIATPVDFQEIPEDAASETVPWYRTDKCTVWFRNVSDLVLAKQLFVDDINALVRTFDVLTSENGFSRQTSVEFSENGVHSTDIPEEDAIQKEIDEMKKDISGKISKDAMSGVNLETNTPEGIRSAVQEIGNTLGARIVKTVVLALSVLSIGASALGAGFSGEHVNQIDYDENPVIVTNVTFDGLATLVDITNLIDHISTNFVPALRKEIADASEAGTNYVDSATNRVLREVVPITRTINGAALTNDVTLTGADIAVSESDETTIDAALAGKASTADATLTPIHSDTPTFSEWTFSDVSDGITDIQQPVFTLSPDEEWVWSVGFGYDGRTKSAGIFSSEDATNLPFVYADEGLHLHLTATRTRTDIVGYTLGSQTNKPLASATLFPVQTADIADGAVTNAKLSNEAVSGAKIRDKTITRGKIADSAVDSTPTEGSNNLVSSGGVSAALAGKVPTTRTINGAALSADVTLTGANIPSGRSGVPQTESITEAFSSIGYDLGALGSELSRHTSDATIHVTAAEKATWNGKQDALTQTQLANIAAVPNKADSDGPTITSGMTVQGSIYAERIYTQNSQSQACYGPEAIEVPSGGVAFLPTLAQGESGTLALAASNPTAGNLAALDAQGNPTNSENVAADAVRLGAGASVNTSKQTPVAIGKSASASANSAVAIGGTITSQNKATVASGDGSIALGAGAKASGAYSAQIGQGENSANYTFQFRGLKLVTLVNGQAGIPAASLHDVPALESVPDRAIAASTAYAVGDVLGDGGKAYRCKLAYTSAGTPASPSSDTTHWVEVPVLKATDERLAGMRGKLDLNVYEEVPAGWAFTALPEGSVNPYSSLFPEWDGSSGRWMLYEGGTLVGMSGASTQEATDIVFLLMNYPQIQIRAVHSEGGTTQTGDTLAKKSEIPSVPVASVNGKTGEVTLTGADIAVSGTDTTKVAAALAGKLNKSGGTMTGNLTVYNEDGSYAEIKAETAEGSIAIRQRGNVSTLETDDDTYVIPAGGGILALAAPNPTVDNLAAFDRWGTLTDSGIAKTNVLTKSSLSGETMPANPTQNELAEAVKKIFTALGGTVTP